MVCFCFFCLFISFDIDILVPGQVANLTITRVTDSEVKITWNSPIDSTGISQYHFLVKQRSGSNVNEELIQAQNDYSQYNVNNLGMKCCITVHSRTCCIIIV